MPTPNRGSWPGGWDVEREVEAAGTAVIDERAFADCSVKVARWDCSDSDLTVRTEGVTVVAELTPDQTGIADFGLDPTSAFSALAARLRGELPVNDVWFLQI